MSEKESNEFELRADRIFRQERENSSYHNFSYSSQEREAIQKMASFTEDFYFLNHFERRDLPPSANDEYLEGQYRYRLQLEENAELKGQWPIPYFFICRKQVIIYDSCYEYSPSFNDKDEFSLFLTFKLRNLSIHKIHDCLDYHLEINGTEFFSFYNYSFLEYDYLFNDKHKKVINDWLEKRENNQSNLYKKIRPVLKRENVVAFLENEMEFLKGTNGRNELILSTEKYDYLFQLSCDLILSKKVPPVIEKVEINRVSRDALRYLYYRIHGNFFKKRSGMKPIFLDFLHDVFINFEGEEKYPTTNRKFSHKPKIYPI